MILTVEDWWLGLPGSSVAGLALLLLDVPLAGPKLMGSSGLLTTGLPFATRDSGDNVSIAAVLASAATAAFKADATGASGVLYIVAFPKVAADLSGLDEAIRRVGGTGCQDSGSIVPKPGSMYGKPVWEKVSV